MSEPKLVCKHYLISGRVQGVLYRVSAKRRAKELGITGSVANLSDGRVEVIACAELPRLMRFYDWLMQGPPNARVDQITEKPFDYQSFTSFDILG